MIFSALPKAMSNSHPNDLEPLSHKVLLESWEDVDMEYKKGMQQI